MLEVHESPSKYEQHKTLCSAYRKQHRLQWCLRLVSITELELKVKHQVAGGMVSGFYISVRISQASLNHVWSVLLYKSFKKGFIWSWSWFEASCFTDTLRKASFEAGSGLKLFLLQIIKEKLHLRLELVWSIFLYKSLKKDFIWGWSWFETSCFTNPLRKSSFEAGSGLKHFALQLF